MIQRSLDALGGRRYLELGVKDGACFHALEADTKVGVDPRFAFRLPFLARARAALGARSGTLYFPTTSDAFFERHGRRLAPFDVVFVDGLHTYEQAYRDVRNALAVLRPGGVVLVHDCNPQTAAAAAPSLTEAARTDGFTGDWNGDVYRAIVRLRTDDGLDVSVLDADQGVGVVRRGTHAWRVAHTVEEIEQLDYAELERDRVRLLGLRPASDLDALLAPRAGH